MADAAQVSFDLLWELMAEHQIHLPRQQQIIHGGHQTQAILMAHPWSLKAEIDVGTKPMTAHGTRSEQPDRFQLRPASQEWKELLLGLFRNPGDPTLIRC